MTDYYLMIDKLRFIEGVQFNGRLSLWPEEILEKMFDYLVSTEGMNVNAFCEEHDLRYYSVTRLFDRLEMLEVTNQSRPKVYRFKRSPQNPVTDMLIKLAEELEALKGFRDAIELEGDYREVAARLNRAHKFATSVADSLNMYVVQHDDPTATFIVEHRDDPKAIIDFLMKNALLYLNSQDRG